MNKLDILYTPLDTPSVPKTDITKLLAWVESYRLDQNLDIRMDQSKNKKIASLYPWNIIYPRIKNNWCYDFDSEFPELADFFSSAYKLAESEVTDVVLLPVRSDFQGLGFWHSDLDSTGLRCYIENQEPAADFLMIKPTVEAYKKRPYFGVMDPEFTNTPLQNTIMVATLMQPNQTFYLNNVRAVHAVNTSVAGAMRIAVIIVPDIAKVESRINDLIVRSAEKYKDYALYWKNTII